MFRLLLWFNDRINRTGYDSALRSWMRRKEVCDRHNEAVRSNRSFPYDAFGHEKVRDPGPPPDAAEYMNRSLSDNWWRLVLLGAVVLFVLGYCVWNRLGIKGFG